MDTITVIFVTGQSKVHRGVHKLDVTHDGYLKIWFRENGYPLHVFYEMENVSSMEVR